MPGSANRIDFIGIGPARTGTTWVYECLKPHPQICLPTWDKKTHFFDLYFDRGVDWYLRQFPACPQTAKRGEITENYLFYPEVPQRIFRLFPEAKIFTCLRNPLKRAVSTYMHLMRDGGMDVPFEQALTKYEKGLVSDNLYYDLLAPYFDLFPASQIQVTIFEEDLKPGPLGYLQNLYAFLGVERNFTPPGWDQVVNPMVSPRFPLLNKAMLWTQFALRRLDVYKYLAPLKDLKAVERLRYKREAVAPPVLSAQTQARLAETFAPQIAKLSRLIGRDLSCWQ